MRFDPCENPKDGLTDESLRDLQRSQFLMNYSLNRVAAIPQ